MASDLHLAESRGSGTYLASGSSEWGYFESKNKEISPLLWNTIGSSIDILSRSGEAGDCLRLDFRHLLRKSQLSLSSWICTLLPRAAAPTAQVSARSIHISGFAY
jgi:hypothetical protein